MSHKLSCREKIKLLLNNLHVCSVKHCMVALKASLVSESRTERSARKGYVKFCRTSGLNCQRSCTLCCRGVHGIHKEMRNRIYITDLIFFCLLSVTLTAALGFLHSLLLRVWQLGRGFAQAQEGKLRVVTAMTTTA